MAENNDSSSSSSSRAPARPSLNLPPRTTMESLFTGGLGVSPSPMSLVSRFFSENDPDTDCRSFSQLLAGALNSSPAAGPMGRPSFRQSRQGESSKGSKGKDGDGNLEFRQSRPAGLVVTQPSVFTIPAALSPATMLDSPGLFSYAQLTAQSIQAQGRQQTHISGEPERSRPPSLSNTPDLRTSKLEFMTMNVAKHQKRNIALVPDPPVTSTIKESYDISSPGLRSQPPIITGDKPVDDGYNWRKYGQKHVKGSEFPRSYYKCTSPNCPVKKKVERSLDGQVTEIVYKGQHSHHQPSPSSKRAKEGTIPDGTQSPLPWNNMDSGSTGMAENMNTERDHDSNHSTHEHVSPSSDIEDVSGDDEPELKRRNIEIHTSSEHAMLHRTVAEPRIIVQTTSEVDLLDDGYKWRKYGQKVVKGNPYPRSYYKCTYSGCKVRKHVERAANDPKAVLTTYEGKHNHDLPTAKANGNTTVGVAPSQLKPHDSIVDTIVTGQMIEFMNKREKPLELTMFKEEQMT